MSVHLGGLLVDVWDDERRRLSGGRPALLADGAAGVPTLGTRLFAITVDDLDVGLLRHEVAGVHRT